MGLFQGKKKMVVNASDRSVIIDRLAVAGYRQYGAGSFYLCFILKDYDDITSKNKESDYQCME